MVQTKLKTLREELQPKVTQEDIAHSAGLRLNTYRNAEYGKNVSYTTAMAILKALNTLRSERGIADIDLKDLGLTIV